MLTLPITGEVQRLPCNIVAIMGERRRGKDFLTDFLVKEYGAKRLSFSDEVRHLAEKMFPWAPIWSDDKDTPFVHPYNPFNRTIRDMIKIAGKVREVDPEFAARQFMIRQYPHVVENPDTLHIITDFRTEDEYNVVIGPLNIPTIKIRADVNIPPDDFEYYVRCYTPTANFFNRMNGTDDFHLFFKSFARHYGVVGLGD